MPRPCIIPHPNEYAGGVIVPRKDANRLQRDYALPSDRAGACVDQMFRSSSSRDPFLREGLVSLYLSASGTQFDLPRLSDDDLKRHVRSSVVDQRLVVVPREVEELERLRKEALWELSKAAVDAAGIVDPTPASDAVGALMSLVDGDMAGVGASILGMIVPYAGDAIAKPLKATRTAQRLAEIGKKMAENLEKLPKPRATMPLEAVEAAPEIVEARALRSAAPDAPKAPSPNAPKPPAPVELQTSPLQPKYEGEHLPGNTVWKAYKGQVKYLTKAEREQYRLTIKDGKLYNAAGRPYATVGPGAIFVMDKEGNLFASNLKEVGRFHHSTLAGGEPVAMAGEMHARDGVLIGINNHSGHYLPTRQQGEAALKHLENQGLDTSPRTVHRMWKSGPPPPKP